MAAAEKKKAVAKVSEVYLKVLVMLKGVVAIVSMEQPMECQMVKCKVSIL